MPNKLFINISNHPTSRWAEDQLAAARELGDVVDMPFPQVDPASVAADIEGLATGYVQRVNQLASGSAATVHIMGEMTFVFAFVSRCPCVCVASTTDRKAVETVQPDGTTKKETVFQFVQFREYV